MAFVGYIVVTPVVDYYGFVEENIELPRGLKDL